MDAIRRIAVTIIALLVLTACGEEGFFGATVITEGEHTIAQGEQIRGELVIMDGDVRLEDGSSVSGSVHVLGGTLVADGEIRGDLSVLGGHVAIQPDASITGDLVHGGGTLEQAAGASVPSPIIESSAEDVPLSPAWTDRTLASRLLTLLFTALIPMAVAYVVLRLRPHPLMRVSDTITSHCLVSGSLGLLSLVIGLVLAVFMVFTIVLIPIAVLILLLLALVAFMGWISLGLAVGQHLARWRGWTLQIATTGVIGIGLLAVLVHLVELIPLIGPLVPIAATVVSFGAMLLTRFGRRRFVPHVYQTDVDTAASAAG